MAPSVSPAPVRCKITGVTVSAAPAVIGDLMQKQPAPVWLVVTETTRKAEQLVEDVGFFLREMMPDAAAEVVLLPETATDTRDMREAFAAAGDRMAALSRLRSQRKTLSNADTLVVITTPLAISQSVPALEDLERRELTLVRGSRVPFASLIDQLKALDYDSEAVCEAPGQYAVRGGLIDVYPVAAEQPCRLDFFGDDLEEIRAYDPVTQRSGDIFDRVVLPASPRIKLPHSTAGLAEYLNPRCQLILMEPQALEELISAVSREDGDAGDATAFTRIANGCAAWFGISDLDLASHFLDEAETEVTWDTESLANYRRYPGEALVAQERLAVEEEARMEFLTRLLNWSTAGEQIIVVTPKEGEEKRAKEIIDQNKALKKRHLLFARGNLNEGFRIRPRQNISTEQQRSSAISWSGERLTNGLVVITETELFGRQRTRRSTGGKKGKALPSQIDQLLDFSELVEGDFVVHLQHGIALFRGLTKIEAAGGLREVISLEFEDHVTLHVPLQESHLISRYVGLSKVRPQLGKIGSGRWEKTRRAAETATVDLAAELLQIQAKRDAQPGNAFPGDNEWQKEFEGSFPYTETPDQLKAIEASKSDMELTRPMDRLICGDVGFGKTEVAIRAAFKAVMGGKQVAVLVPTTVLAQQHLNTFRERMAGYPVAVEMVSRFRTKAEQQKIISELGEGRVDILIGTHRLIQKDVKFKDLGLVIIDEEQRFGVKHKEVFKSWRAHVDVLSMSATPIPRTLYMALTGARDLSVIETAPANRHPIQTIVKNYDDKLVVDAIRHEIRRGGQVFYLHNRVMTIDAVAQHLRKLLPDLDIGVGHGQMHEDDLERAMTDFVAGKYHVLVCTTIIESGLDLPNCNTIIIEGADRFGLSQLYQLRGRVGRFKHQAYAYLLLHRQTRVLDIARERLTALRQHNQLGAGFRIAMRDLELRGAGNLLGAEQSGHIVGVGFELYCQLLRQSVARLKGEKTAAAIRATVKIDFVFVGEGEEASRRRFSDAYTAIRNAEIAESAEVARIQARLPFEYIGETRLRIDIYRRLALADTPARVKNIETELRDRFGRFGDGVRALLLITEIRTLAEQKNLISVETEGNRLKCLRNSGRRDDFVQMSARFPRLTASKPLLRLREIVTFLRNLP